MLWFESFSASGRGAQSVSEARTKKPQIEAGQSEVRHTKKEVDNQNGNEASHSTVYLSGLFFNFFVLLFLV